MPYDVAIIGAGPAGLSAALMLGRCRRQVIVFDSDRPRNAASRALHGFLTRDGIAPRELRTLAREEVSRYPSVELTNETVVAATRTGQGFRVTTKEGRKVDSAILLLATGREDTVPAKPGFAENYGRRVFHCPYCDGWEHRDEALVVFGHGTEAVGMAQDLLTWSRDVTLCTDGAPTTEPERAELARCGVALNEAAVAGLAAPPDQSSAWLHFSNGESRPVGAIFFVSDCRQQSALATELGCKLDEQGAVRCTGHAATEVPGLYVAGNVRGGLHFAVTAAAEGVEAAVAINNALAERR